MKDNNDLREFERKPGKLIPECFNTMLVDLGMGEKYKAQATDFSVKGLRLLLTGPINDFHPHTFLIIYPLNKNFKVIGEVIHTIPLNSNSIYLGVYLRPTKSLTEYKKIINQS